MNNDDNKPNTAITVAIIGGFFALCAAAISVIGAPLVQEWQKPQSTPTQTAPTLSIVDAMNTLIAATNASTTSASSFTEIPFPTPDTADSSGGRPVSVPSDTPIPPPTITSTPYYSGPPLIAFASNSSGKSVIYTMLVDGSSQHAITSFDYDSITPSWSPDGQWIYFSSNREGSYDIYKMRWDGSDVTRLTFDPKDEKWPNVSPNGLKLIYHVDFGTDNYQIFVNNIEGTNPQNISNSSMNEERPSWSANSLWVVFSYCRGPNSPADLKCEIWRMNADGSDKKPISITSYSEIWPSISPDGTTIAFVANIRSFDNTAASNIEIFLANSDYSNIRRLTNDPEIETDPSWSPDGSRILFKSAPDTDGDTDIWVISSNGSGLSRLTSLPGSESHPVWQPLR